MKKFILHTYVSWYPCQYAFSRLVYSTASETREDDWNLLKPHGRYVSVVVLMRHCVVSGMERGRRTVVLPCYISWGCGFGSSTKYIRYPGHNACYVERRTAVSCNIAFILDDVLMELLLENGSLFANGICIEVSNKLWSRTKVVLNEILPIDESS